MTDYRKDNTLTLCYLTNKIARPWICEYGYETKEETNKRIKEILSNNDDTIIVTLPHIPEYKIGKELNKYNNFTHTSFKMKYQRES